MSIPARRTADEHFENLPGFSFAPHYLDHPAHGLRMHYLDEGPRDAAHTFLCLHGEPTWCYLYRTMIPVFSRAGHRVVAPDFFGFGRSDKPTDDAVYTFSFHRDSLVWLIEALDLRGITLVCQDWGGILGLTLPMDMPDRIARLFVMNTALCTGEVAPTPGFLAWRTYVAQNPDFSIPSLMKRGVRGLSDAEAAAYAAPFPDASYRAGVRAFPAIVPVDASMAGADTGRRAAAFLAREWTGASYMVVGKEDPVLGPPVMARLAQTIRGCPEPVVLERAGHFVQEAGESVAEAALAAFA